MAKEQGTGSRGLCDPVPGDHRPRLATQPVHEGHHRPPAGFKRRFHLRSPVGGRRWKPEYCRPPAPGQPLTPRRESGMGRGFILILSSWVLPCHPERSEGSSRPNERDPSVATLPQDDNYFFLSLRCFTYSTTAGIVETTMMAAITREKLFLMTGMFPNRYPPHTNKPTHAIPAAMLYVMKRPYFIEAIPATNGANVRMIGRNLAKTMVLAPYCSKNRRAFSR